MSKSCFKQRCQGPLGLESPHVEHPTSTFSALGKDQETPKHLNSSQLYFLCRSDTQGWNQGVHGSEAWIEKILMNLPWQNHPWAGSKEQAGSDTCSGKQTPVTASLGHRISPSTGILATSTGNFPAIYHTFHTSSCRGAVAVVQHLQVWRDQAKSAVRSFLGIVLLRNEGKRGARILSQCSTAHFTECTLCSSQTHCAS